jgi:excinuclease ABC subunit C
MTEENSRIREQLRNLPQSPGVYIMKDSGGKILYIGKAASLKNRVSSYFGSPQKLTLKIQTMVSLVDDFDYFVTSSEQEALILEANLIKQHRPHYNSLLKDDKSFPFLKIDMNEEWPGVSVTRRLVDDGSYYFGPFASARSVRQSMKTLKQIFPFRSCSNPSSASNSRACLWFHMGKCLAPCTGAVSHQEYHQMIKRVIHFLNGKPERVTRELEKKMQETVAELQFEKAAFLRDQIISIQRVVEGQRIATRVRGEQDAIAFAEDRDETFVQVFFIRNSKLVGREGFVLQGTRSEDTVQIMTSFVKQFYYSSLYVPPLLLLQYGVEDKEVIEGWLSGKRKGRVRIEVPSRGIKKELIAMVAQNAQQGLEQLKLKRLSSQVTLGAALDEIEAALELPHTPTRIEGYDISNIQGKDAVGSMVVFEEGRPRTSNYRRFKIKTVTGADDYAMLQEVLKRRFSRSRMKNGNGTAIDNSWAVIPDLVLIDGGKGQLNAARDIMSDVGVEYIPVASLAKENEELFIPGRAHPIIMPRSSPGLRLLQRLRDEAHRFAIGYHRKVHKRGTFASSLDAVSGVGPARKRALLRKFGSVRAIQAASLEELSAVKGMNLKIAQRIKESL